MISPTQNLSTRLNRKGEVWAKVASSTKDALGQYPITETKIAEVWVGVMPQTGSLMNGRAAETVLAATTHKVIMRYRPDVSPDMWLMINGKRFNILYIIDPYEMHERLELFCEVLGNGC